MIQVVLVHLKLFLQWQGQTRGPPHQMLKPTEDTDQGPKKESRLAVASLRFGP